MGIDVTLPWNPEGLVPLHKWLSLTQSPEDKCRLETLGNVVVPLQATKAMSIITQMESLA